MKTVTIVGAGLAGSLLACHLGKLGHAVDLHERRGDPRRAARAEGRSINLALSYRGIEALREIGLAEKLLELSIPMRGRMVHAADGHLAFVPYGAHPHEYINSISRAGLNAALLDEAGRYPGVRVSFDHRAVDVDLATGEVRLETPEGPTAIATEVLVAADGAFSAVRARMAKQDRFDHAQSYLPHGYKELSIPPAADGGFRLESNALHIWPRGSFMMIALPNLDRSFTVTLFFPFEGPTSFATLRTADDVRRFFEATFPDAVPHMPTLAEDWFANPTGSLVTIRCRPWHAGARVALLGDAAHAVVPFYGQGMNAAFEDCIDLAERIRLHAPDWDRVFEEYERSRRPDTDALAELCIYNYVEMRDLVARRSFRAKKKVEHLLHRLFPRAFLPLYTMVTFTRIPYAEAKRRAARQDRLLALGAVILGTVLLVLLVLLAVALTWN